MPCLNPLCTCDHGPTLGDQPQQPRPAKTGESFGTFIRRRARHFEHLFCSVCRIHPPRHPGGPCDDCERELGVGG